ncbi:MAG: hypothetical protein JNK23_11520 [Opitutaceae bacterium]|nr:hypothetical protein [Opitutaceae bacterium]
MALTPGKLLRHTRNALQAQQSLWAGRPAADPVFAYQAIDSWLAALASRSLPPARGRIAITALRSLSWIEWAAYAAAVLRTLGWETTLLFRGSQIRRLYPEPRAINFWARVPDLPGVELIDLETEPRVNCADDGLRALAQRLAPTNVAYDLHLEECDISADPVAHGPRVAARADEIVAMGEALDGLLARRSFARLVCYSGLIAESPGLLHVARRRGVLTVCLEGWAWRPGHLIYNRDAPAMAYNVAGWMRSLGPWNAEKEREVNAYLKFLDGEKHDGEWLANFHRIQRDTLAQALPPDLRAFLEGAEPVFVLATNVIGDSSTLGCETIFAGQQPWIAQVVRWFAARPHLKLVIRAHPAERWIGGKCAIYLGEVSRKLAGGHPNIRVIGSEESMNTFALVPFARAGLAWLSSAGVDFVVRGIPAAVAARPKYTGLGIVEEPATQEEYFALIERWAGQVERPAVSQITQGKRYLHLVFKGFSFEATGRNFRATGMKLGAMPSQAEHDRFYRILCGDEPMPDVAEAMAGA